MNTKKESNGFDSHFFKTCLKTTLSRFSAENTPSCNLRKQPTVANTKTKPKHSQHLQPSSAVQCTACSAAKCCIHCTAQHRAVPTANDTMKHTARTTLHNSPQDSIRSYSTVQHSTAQYTARCHMLNSVVHSTALQADKLCEKHSALSCQALRRTWLPSTI